MRKFIHVGLVCCFAAFTFGCATSVKRMDVDEVKDISGRWNDTDSRLVSEEIIADCLSRPWYSNAKTSLKRLPVITVGTISNQSSEHIDTITYVEDLQQSIINSGKAEFVASKNERGQLRDEKMEQDIHASEESRKDLGQELGADFMLTGIFTSIMDEEGGKTVVLYQINMKLIDIKTNRIVWNGSKKIKKYVKRSRSKW